jgi:ankyrin repeat protein
MIACKKGYKGIVDIIMANNGNINESNIMGDTPLKLAQRFGHAELALTLIQKYKASMRPKSLK